MKSYKKFANIYDQLIYEDVNYDKISEKIYSLCNKYSVSFDDYLDLACGTGNVAKRVGKEFKNIFLVDISDDMLVEADKKLTEEKIKAKIVCQDMTELNLNRKFDLITCVLDSTNYILEENDLIKYFEGVKNHLKDNGIFIFDINSYYKLSDVLGNNVFTYNSEEVFYVWENIFEDNIVEMNLTFFVNHEGLYERFDEVHEERAYREEEIESIITKAGLQICDKFDGYTDDKVNKGTERIIYILRK
ncbi:S-adenosylmethionine-dependent methyltransferase [Clostridium polyendosporum]|uniref:S-adenosylmethionine-dependent methyltransferase n=1 Tax=Clostridium polyendosporum TaxID=69208 RepID=A0A919VGI9_9CLOT|nr:class I SAM-dependent methyltransferase [Clostridium polyendosporum]GIM28681.1 S-adenosylmethionine-dependent methyltransferase [Clostridium polyendosporum]